MYTFFMDSKQILENDFKSKLDYFNIKYRLIILIAFIALITNFFHPILLKNNNGSKM